LGQAVKAWLISAVSRPYSSALAAYLRRWQEHVLQGQPLLAPELPVHSPYKAWRVQDKLSDDDVQALLNDFSAGTAKHVLATRYSISLSSVKRLLRQHGVRRRQRGDTLP
jgi:hypothetical protein